MFFSRRARSAFAVLLLAAGALFTQGCSLSTSDQPPALKDQEFKAGDRVNCLSQVLPTLSGFVNGSARPQEVEATWDCFRAALNLYSTYVRGREENRYTARELATFFETYFFANLKINDRLLLEIMHIKQIVVGGDELYLTREELAKLIAFSQDMKVLSLRVLPYMRVYSLNWRVSAVRTLDRDIQYFEDANAVIQETMKDLAAIIAKNKNTYTISNVSVLLDEMSKLYGAHWDIVDQIEKVMPLVQKLKKTLAGGDEFRVAPNEWRRFTLLSARGYIQFLRYYYFIQKNPGSTGAAELVYLARSFDDLFSYLGDMVTEKPQGYLTRTEIYEVLQALSVFLPSVQISEIFVLEVMKLKQVLIGGSLDYFTPQDFLNARSKVEAIRQITEKFLKYVDVYNFVWKPNPATLDDNFKYFREAEANLADLLRALAGLAEAPYDLNDFLIFAEEFEKIVPPKGEEFSFAKALRRYLPVVKTGRQVYFSNTGDIIAKSEWTPFLLYIGQIYAKAIQLRYFVMSPDVSIQNEAGLSMATVFVRESLQTIDKLIDQKPRKVVTFDELENLVAAFQPMEFWPEKFDLETLNGFIKTVLTKFLNDPEKRIKKQFPAGLTKQATTVLLSEYKLWESGQRLLSALYQADPNAFISPQAIQKALKAAPKDPSQPELLSIYLSPQTRAVDSKNRLVISNTGSSYSYNSTVRVNLARMIARLMIRSSAGELKRVQTQPGITKDEANALFQEVKPLAVSLDLLKESNTTFANSRFLESNLFTPRGDGDNLVNFIEATDLVINILSGLKLNQMASDLLKSEDPTVGCPVVQAKDGERVSINCFTNVYRQHLSDVFLSMPDLAKSMAKMPRCTLISKAPWIAEPTLNSEQARARLPDYGIEDVEGYIQTCNKSFDMMLLNMLKTSGYKTEPKGIVALSDAALVPHIMQYIESIMQRFDHNKDGVLSKNEAMGAYPVFKTVLADVSGFSDDLTLKGLLAWFLIHGKPPEGTWEQIKFFVIFRADEANWKINAEREKLAAILGFIAVSMDQPNISILPEDPSGKTQKTPHGQRQF